MGKFEAGMEAMLDMYIFETSTLLEQLDEILIRTEDANNFLGDDINEIFRIMHTIKGSSAMMGLEKLSILAHKLEDMFFIIRDNNGLMTDVRFIYDIVFQASDLFKAEVELIQGENYDESDFSHVISKIEGAITALKEGKTLEPAAKPAVPKAAKLPEKAAGKTESDEKTNLTTVRVYFEDGCKMENLRAFLLVNKLKDDCEFLDYFPADVESNADSSKYIVDNGFIIKFKAFEKDEFILKQIEEAVNVQSYEVIAEFNPDNVKEVHKVKEDEAIEEKVEAAVAQTEVIAAKTVQPDDAGNNTVKSAAHSKQSLISVNLTKLDQLHDIVGEIIITESMVTSSPDLKGLSLDQFQKSARQLRKLTDELQDTVMSIRMVPLSGVFQKMNRIVRDMKIKLNKDVDLVFEGEQTEVDKSIIDNLNDPLMHLVRNCMDHGIEATSADRVKKGKNPKATVTLSAQNSSGEVIIVVADDGRGIDTATVLKKAAQNGLLTKPENEYTEKEIHNMILLPGFSTKESVTEFSGRGVGMDVVKKNIEKCGGTINVESKPNKGTSFIIKIPLTLAIIAGMEISVGDSMFTVPISTIEQSFKVMNSEIIKDTEQGEMIMLRGVCYPILRLHETFSIPTNITELEEGILLLVESDGKSVCLFADKLIGEQQVVVKPFPIFLNRYNIKQRGISGCTIMGDGSISLIIDVNNLIVDY